MTARHSVTVKHTFEAGHRLPHLMGKCQSLHGHSWAVTVTVTGDVTRDGVLVEFADLKRHLRGWVDEHLDHGVILGRDDLLTDLLLPYGKVYVMGQDHPSANLAWPTVENVATLLQRVMTLHLIDTHQQHAYVSRVDVQETAVNMATWEAP